MCAGSDGFGASDAQPASSRPCNRRTRLPADCNPTTPRRAAATLIVASESRPRRSGSTRTSDRKQRAATAVMVDSRRWVSTAALKGWDYG